MTVINRREFIAGGLASIGIAALAGNHFYNKKNTFNDLSFLSASDDKQGNHFIGGWSLNGEHRFLIPVPHRAHDSCCSPDKTLGLFFARRPGTQLYIVDLNNGELRYTMNAKKGYHFYGHGVFSSDGRYLFTTENHYQTKNIEQSGIIAVYDTLDTDHNGFKRIDEYTCGGIGPHQLALLNDGHTLAIAMGGILTHPDKQRDKLNIDSMKPSLTYLDTRNGKILDQFYPTHHQMSIRHLAVSTTDQVIMGVQYQGDKHHHIPLVLSHQGEVQLQTLKANQSLWAQQNQYIASIAIDNKARYAISTSPRGGGVCLWDLCNLQNLAQHSIRDVAGALYSTDKQCFLVSNGTGQLMALSPNTKTFSAQAVFLNRTVRWDNHLSLAS